MIWLLVSADVARRPDERRGEQRETEIPLKIGPNQVSIDREHDWIAPDNISISTMSSCLPRILRTRSAFRLSASEQDLHRPQLRSSAMSRMVTIGTVSRNR